MTAVLSVVRVVKRGLVLGVAATLGVLALSGPALADRDWRKHDDRRYHRHHHPHYYAPPPRVVVRPPPVYYAPPPPVYYYPPAYYAPRPYPPHRSGGYIYFGF